jgi:ABC-type branched-subunit amino acid transport system ATPase component/branched-subunit amino acid ABC-type transport system permease component
MISELVPFILVGLTAGAVYGMTATGLVLTFKTSGIFNFAQGAVATVATYAFYELQVKHGLPWPVALVLSVVVLGAIMGLLLERMARVLGRMSTAMKVVGTLGIVLMVQGLASIVYGTDAITINPYLPQKTFEVGGLVIGADQLIVIGVSVVVTGALYVFFRVSRLGTAMRAVVDNPTLLASQGTNPVTVRRASWIVGTMFASLSGVLLVPFVGLNSLVLTLLIVQAFGAAAIGAFSNLPLTYVGGLVIGVAAAIATKYVTTGTILGGLPPAIPFIVLFLVLILVPRAKLAGHQITQPRPQPVWRAPLRLQLGGGALLAVVLVLIPFIVGTKLSFYTNALAGVLLFLSLGILVRSSGQISLAHMAFAAIGAAEFAHFTTSFHIPWIPALLLAGLIAVPVGALIAIPAIRLSGLFLALATLGFGIVMENMFYTSSLMFGATSDGLRAPRPSLSWLSIDSDQAFYYIVLVIVVLFSAAAVWLDHARFGRLLRGMADAPLALNTLGTSVNVTRVLVFCISAFLAAISGALMASSATAISGASFPSFASLTLVVLLALIPGRVPWYAFGGAFSLFVVPSFFSGININDYLTVLFGIAAIHAALTVEEHGRVPVKVLDRIDRLFGRSPAPAAETADPVEAGTAVESDETVPAAEAAEPVPAGSANGSQAADNASGITVADLLVRFGGAVAVNNISLAARHGAITGLIGPNGAGKTTTFNACSGLLKPTNGSITLMGRDISRLSAAARGRIGLGRTFQRMELFNSLTVEENVALGAEASIAGAQPLRQIRASRSERQRIDEATASAIELSGIDHLRSLQVGLLSTGQRRLVELARCLAGPYEMLLLDEPSSGLNPKETERFGQVLRRIVAQRNVGMLLVEHDMSLVMSLCDYIYVLDFGNLLFAGTAAEVAASNVVKEAYLGATQLPEHVATPDLLEAIEDGPVKLNSAAQ